MTTLYKKGSQYKSRFGGVMYEFDIVKSKDDLEIAKLIKAGWCETLPDTVKEKAKPKAKAKSKAI